MSELKNFISELEKKESRIGNYFQDKKMLISSLKELEEVIGDNPEIGKKYSIFILDDIFGLNKKWRREFLALYRERIKIPFVCLLRCDVVTEDTMQDLAKGYCQTIQFGVESVAIT